MIHILLVEDEPNVREPLAQYLTLEGFRVSQAKTLKEADLRIHEMPELILLDWMLPDGQSIESLKKWREQGIRIPVILLTARAELIDKVVGLEIGANDYITKPFEPRELLARVRVQLRLRNGGQSQSSIESTPTGLHVSEIELNLKNHEAFYKGNKIELTKTEFELLKLFLENPDQVFSREELLRQVWGYAQSPTTRTVDTHMLQLRQKTDPELFQTVHGVGYRFKVKKS